MYFSRLPGTSFSIILVQLLSLLFNHLCYANPVFPIPVGLNCSDPGAISALVQTVLGDTNTVYPLVPTTYAGTIVARFCEPTVKTANRSDVVQYFVSGFTENKLYWSGLGYPTGYNGGMYSTIAYASSQGYPTFVIDRIGVGDTRPLPDPILQEQVNLEGAINHKLVTMLKAGTAVPGRTFNRVVYVGHSYGSVLGNAQATNHPSDIAAFILPPSLASSSHPPLTKKKLQTSNNIHLA